MPNLDPEDDIFVSHAYSEQRVDLGEIEMNYATAGAEDKPALLLVPPQTQSWWAYEDTMPILGKSFHVHAVDLRGQGRSTRTPGRYTLDNMGNDLVRFIDDVIQRPTIVSGNSSGAVLAAWLAAYAKPGQLAGAICEDPPLFASETTPAVGHSIRQAVGPVFQASSKWLGDQWSIGDWRGMQAASPKELPPYLVRAFAKMMTTRQTSTPLPADPNEPPQNMKEYDPEWARAFWTGTVAASCDHARMLAAVKVPVLLTHHYREIDDETGSLMGALSDAQAKSAGELITSAGQRFDYVDLPQMTHSMHAQDPEQFASVVSDWAATLSAK